MKSTLRITGLALVAGVMLTSCASDPAKAAPKKQQEEEYVYVKQTGSLFPVKVPKKKAHASESETEKSQEVLREAQRRGNRAVSDTK